MKRKDVIPTHTTNLCSRCGQTVGRDFEAYTRHLEMCRVTRPVFKPLTAAVKGVIVQKGEAQFGGFLIDASTPLATLVPDPPKIHSEGPMKEIEIVIDPIAAKAVTTKPEALVAEALVLTQEHIDILIRGVDSVIRHLEDLENSLKGDK